MKAQNEDLKRPTRPDTFHTPEQVAQYVHDMHEYLRAKSIRYGKRFAPMANSEAGDDLQTNERINDLHKQQLAARDESVAEVNEENPLEQLALYQMHPIKETNLYRLLTQIPLPLLAKYLHINQIMNQNENENGVGAYRTSIRQTMLHPFVRQRFISAKQKNNDF